MAKKNSAKNARLRVDRMLDVPLREVSGICVRRGQGGRTSLIAVGDRHAQLAWVDLTVGGNQKLDWQTADISALPGSALPNDHPQIEAVCADGVGDVLLLQEAPPRAEFIDVAGRRVAATIELVVDGDGELADAWSDPDASRGEGAVLLPGGHLLVAKEKHPAALIEFGPKGARSGGLARGGALATGARWPVEPGKHRFVALAVWLPDKALKKACDDFSDLEIGPDGRLYLLSDKSTSIARLEDLPPGGGTASLSAAWQLDDLDDKPEGLTFAPNGCAIVALDKRKARNNLLVLEPAIAAS
jgi:hypothetical protein